MVFKDYYLLLSFKKGITLNDSLIQGIPVPIIEDEKQIGRILTLELSYEGYETVSTSDGQSGLDLALKGEWDLILLDIMLPKLNGMDVLIATDHRYYRL